MAYSITINGVDRTADIFNQTATYNDVINDEVNDLQLSLVDIHSLGAPATAQEIIITDASGNKLFAGYITKIQSAKLDTGMVRYDMQCVDYVWLLDRNLVHKSYTSMTDKAIIEDIIATYCAGFGITTTNVIVDATIDQVSFNYIQPSQVLRKLADLTGNNWYIDENKDIHYFPISTSSTPFNITATNTYASNYYGFKLSSDATQLKNRVYVRGGTKLSDPTTYSVKGDGVAQQFPLPDKPHNISIKVNAVSKTVGIKNIDVSGFDYYVNFEEKYVEQDAAGVILTTSDTLSVTYEYDIPILVALENTASIIASGVKEFAIFDKSISTTAAARDRASAELTDYANNIVEGSFKTLITGFKSGQTININLPEYGINANYIVQKVNGTSFGGGNFEYDISIASAKTMGIIRFLVELLEANKNLIELSSNEVVDELFNIADSLRADSLLDALTTDSWGPYATWSVSTEVTPKTRMIWDLFEWM